MTHDEINAINRTLDSVCNMTPNAAIVWLRGAYHAHESAVFRLRGKLVELRALALANVSRPLTAAEARLLDVCRVCGKRWESGGCALVLNFGAEYAHADCLPPKGPKHLGEGI